MAKEAGSEKSAQQLRQEIAHSRDRVALDLEGLRYELDFPLKFRKSFQRQTVRWLTVAVVIGAAFALAPARTRRVRVRKQRMIQGDSKEGLIGAGLALGALKLIATMLRPAVTRIIARKMSDYAASTGRRG